MLLINQSVLKQFITSNDGKSDVKYKWTHGATEDYLGLGMIFYALTYFYKFKSCIVLGSGGGFVPRIIRQAQWDIKDLGFGKEEDYQVYLVDANNGVNGITDWGEDDWFIKRFYIDTIVDTTEKAYYDYFVRRNIKADMIHIDAGHQLEDVERDFELYSKLLNKNGVITIHDVDVDWNKTIQTTETETYDKCEGPSEFIKKLDKKKWRLITLMDYTPKAEHPTSSGLAVIQKNE